MELAHNRKVIAVLVAIVLGVGIIAAGWCVGYLSRQSTVPASPGMSHNTSRGKPTQRAFHPTSRESVVIADKATYVPPGMTGRQMQSLCGVNCLYLVNRYYGIAVPHEDLTAILAPSGLGVSMARLVEVAEDIGYHTRVLKAPIDDWLKFSSPLIVWMSNDENAAVGHFVVVIPDKEGRRVWWVDPPNQGRWVRVDNLKHKSAPIIVLQPRRRAQPYRSANRG